MKEVFEKAPKEVAFTTSPTKYDLYGIGSEIFRDHEKMINILQEMNVTLHKMNKRMQENQGYKDDYEK